MGQLRDKMRADLELKGYSPGTREQYLRCAERFVAHYMRSPLELGKTEVRCFMLHMIRIQEATPAVQKMFIAALKFLYEVTLGTPAVVADLPWPRIPKSLPDVPSGNEVLRLLEAMRSPKHRAVVTVTYASGMRISEACRLMRSDIDRERKVIHVRAGKGGKDRFVMAGPGLLACIDAYLQAVPSEGEYVFPGEVPGRPISPGAVRMAMVAARRSSGVDKMLTPHSMRHAFATHLLEAGTDIRTIQALMGHNSIRTTAKYMRVSTQHIAGTKSPFDQLANASPEPDPHAAAPDGGAAQDATRVTSTSKAAAAAAKASRGTSTTRARRRKKKPANGESPSELN